MRRWRGRRAGVIVSVAVAGIGSNLFRFLAVVSRLFEAAIERAAVDAINIAIEDIPDDVHVSTHICQGNYAVGKEYDAQIGHRYFDTGRYKADLVCRIECSSYLVEHDIRMPVRARGGARKDELEWRRPNRPTLQNLFANPIYAGAYVYGVRPTDRRRQKAGRPSTGRRLLRAEEADVFLPDRVPAYITWDQYQRIQAQLQSNRAAWGGAPRAGRSALRSASRIRPFRRAAIRCWRSRFGFRSLWRSALERQARLSPPTPA